MRDLREKASPGTTANGLSARDDRSPVAIGYGWASHITGFSLEFATLTLLGYWLDVRYSTRPWFMIGGAAVGFIAFVSGLLSVAKRLQSSDDSSDGEDRG